MKRLRISKQLQLLVLFFAFAIFFAGCDVRVITSTLTTEKKLDLGVAPNYEVDFNIDYNFERLAKDGIRRVNLYYQWREFEADGLEGQVTSWENQIDPIINKLKSLGMKASMIMHVTDTDCLSDSPKSCWLDYGIPSDLNFTEFDAEPLATRLEKFIINLVKRYDKDVVTHIFLGNETDQFLRLYPQHAPGFLRILKRIQKALNNIPNRPKFSTIFTLRIKAGENDWAKELASELDVMAFTLYPTLFDEAAFYTESIEELVKKWFGTAQEVVGERSFVVTETGYSTKQPFGTIETQTKYAKNLTTYLKTSGVKAEFVSWWSIADSPTHPDEFFHSMGLTTFDGTKRPAYDIWAKASKGE